MSDFVIVGAGSAGCVLADRLSASGARVTVLEAGGDDRPLRNLSQFRSNAFIGMPAGFTRILGDPAIDWAYLTEPDPTTDGRQYMVNRGKVLGGTSSINGMMYVRGQPQDYDGWRQLGCTGWGWDDVLPYFRKAERHELGETTLRGGSGPLSISLPRHADPVTDAMIQAWHEAGLPIREDINGIEQEGVGLTALTARRGARHSTAMAYLHRAMKRANLRVETRALVRRILFEGRQAVGVEYEQDGEVRTVRANREVILCGGAINSPQLLQLSGVGPGDLLAGNGIPVVHDSPLVGGNLQDHYSVMMGFRMKPGSGGFNALAHGLPLYGQVLRYFLAGRGLLTVAGAHAVSFAKSREGLEQPDLQFNMSPATVDGVKSMQQGGLVLDDEPGFTMAGYVMRPTSRGSVTIRSADPKDRPAIVANYLAEPEDRTGTIAAMRWMRKVAGMPALARYLSHELPPSAGADDDEALLAFARATGNTSFHQTSSCSMGPDARDVLNPSLKVNGIDRLRVVDASAIPRLTSSNTNAPTIMVAEKAADLILHPQI